MHNIEIIYRGNLKTKINHIDSNENITTDAPKDNNGLGMNFSPTDLLASALGSCIFTIIGITANSRNFNIDGSKMKISKIMSINPRMISKIIINIYIYHLLDRKNKIVLEKVALKCPVYRSLNPKIIKEINFHYH